MSEVQDYTEFALAQRFAAANLGSIRFRHGAEMWLIRGESGWDYDRTGEMLHRAMQFCTGLAAAAPAGARARLGRVSTARAVLAGAAVLPGIAASRSEPIEPGVHR